MKNPLSSLCHMKKTAMWCFASLNTKIYFLLCLSSLVWNYLGMWCDVYYTFLSPCKLCSLCLFRYFSVNQFCFYEYLSFLSTFVPYYHDFLCDTFQSLFKNLDIGTLTSASTLGNQHSLSKVFWKIKPLWPIQLMCSFIWHHYHFSTITHFSMIFFSYIQRHPLVLQKKFLWIFGSLIN